MDQLLQKKQNIRVGESSTVYKVKSIITGVLAVKIFTIYLLTLQQKKRKIFRMTMMKILMKKNIIPIEKSNKFYDNGKFCHILIILSSLKCMDFIGEDASHSPGIVFEYYKYNLENSINHLEILDQFNLFDGIKGTFSSLGIKQ